jgi:SAM-dependent methyltransferase
LRIRHNQLREQYRRRFATEDADRQKVWGVLIDAWFGRYVENVESALDLGCGWGPFINQVDVPIRYGIDLNPDAAEHLDAGVTLFTQPANHAWPLSDGSLDLVFTSNFFEHLPSRDAIAETLAEAHRCLRPGGRLVCMGPNIRHTGGAYWDFFDHLIPLTEKSLVEATDLAGFETEEVIGRFLPFTMAGKPAPPAAFVRAYLLLRPAWHILGRQFLVVARRPA